MMDWVAAADRSEAPDFHELPGVRRRSPGDPVREQFMSATTRSYFRLALDNDKIVALMSDMTPTKCSGSKLETKQLRDLLCFPL